MLSPPCALYAVTATWEIVTMFCHFALFLPLFTLIAFSLCIGIINRWSYQSHPLTANLDVTRVCRRVTEIKAAATKSFDDAIRQGMARGRRTLENITSTWLQDREVKVGKNGEISENRVLMKVTFILNDWRFISSGSIDKLFQA